MNLVPRTIDGLSGIDAQAWQALDRQGNPSLSWAFLNALEASGSVAAENGWRPHHLCLFEEDRLVAAAPSYIKSHSRGEFVFDWAWADAYHRRQLDYYPKLLTAVPWTPVAGPRLLVGAGHPQPEALRKALVELALSQCEALELSSWHCNFTAPQDEAALESAGLLARRDWQFHWRNRGYLSFAEFLATLKAKKRKNIRQERRQVREAGVRFEHKRGTELTAEDLRFIHRCYRRTFHAHGNHPALNLRCFEMMAQEMGDGLMAIIAREGDKPLAMSLYLAGGGALYGRYWGSMREVPGLHFETAYYQGIEVCIANGLGRFESGAQGEHKIARGFEPTETRSFHHIRHPAFRAAIAGYLERESEWLDDYRDEVARHEPFRVRL